MDHTEVKVYPIELLVAVGEYGAFILSALGREINNDIECINPDCHYLNFNPPKEYGLYTWIGEMTTETAKHPNGGTYRFHTSYKGEFNLVKEIQVYSQKGNS